VIQNNAISSSGAQLPRCPPIGCRVGIISSAALYKFARIYRTQQNMNKKPIDTAVKLNRLFRKDHREHRQHCYETSNLPAIPAIRRPRLGLSFCAPWHRVDGSSTCDLAIAL
jgi:hypothetical protein